MTENNRKELSSQQINKLYWSCRRGMLELDLILIPFLQTLYPNLDSDLQKQFEILLNYPDPDLHAWIGGRGLPEEIVFHPIIQLLRDFSHDLNRSRTL